VEVVGAMEPPTMAGGGEEAGGPRRPQPPVACGLAVKTGDGLGVGRSRRRGGMLAGAGWCRRWTSAARGTSAATASARQGAAATAGA
jgi:hypothetical protein